MNEYIEKIDIFMEPLTAGTHARLARVGGSVRDELLGRRVKDADYVVFGASLTLLGMMVSDFCRINGAKRSVLKLRDGRQAGYRIFKQGYGLIEIMMPRTEISTGPGHRDFEIVVDHTLSPAEDAVRRDFTFNALYKWIGGNTTTAAAWGPHSQVITNIEDPTGRGLYDLEHRLINTTHPDSFRDDPLRTLRALRFVSVLGYDLSSLCRGEMSDYAWAVNGLNSGENTSGTVLDEMNKLLMGDDCVKALRLMRDTGVMKVLFPELADMIGFNQGSRYHDLTTDEHTFEALRTAVKAEASLRVRWALLFHDAGKPDVVWTDDKGRQHYYARGISEDFIDPYTGKLDLDHEEQSEHLWRLFAERANMPKELREDVATLIRNHMVTLQPRNAGVKVRRWRVKHGDELLSDLLLHRACDCSGKMAPAATQIRQVERLVGFQNEAIDAGVPANRKELAISGKDLVEMGVKGERIGQILDEILDRVVCQPRPENMTRERQLRWAEELASCS